MLYSIKQQQRAITYKISTRHFVLASLSYEQLVAVEAFIRSFPKDKDFPQDIKW